MDNIEYQGEWWLPEDPGKKITGILKFNKIDGIKLELLGSFIDIENDEPFESKFILGTSIYGKRITIYQCFIVNLRYGFSTVQSYSIISAKYAFIGGHFIDEENLRFNEISIECEDLN